jgi:hypothetical protein
MSKHMAKNAFSKSVKKGFVLHEFPNNLRIQRKLNFGTRVFTVTLGK